MSQNLQDICREFEETLSELSTKCHLIMSGLQKLDSYFGSYAIDELRRNLVHTAIWVKIVAVLMHCDHKLQGYVCVLMGIRGGITMVWLEKQTLVANKLNWRAYGYEVLSTDEFDGMINAMIEKLDCSTWANSLQWLNNYRHSWKQWDTSKPASLLLTG